MRYPHFFCLFVGISMSAALALAETDSDPPNATATEAQPTDAKSDVHFRVGSDESEPRVAALEKKKPDTPEVAVDEATAEDKVDETVEPVVETIRERYPNRAVKIERQVIRDSEDNYVNHGAWRMWDRDGNMIAKGNYVHGKRHGDWKGWFLREESKLLTSAPFDQFEAPFESVATFKDGNLHGEWAISDAKERVVSAWQYVDGVRHGTWAYWHVSGKKMREAEYYNGKVHGHLREWSRDGNLQLEDEYRHGQRLGFKLETYPDKQKMLEGGYLYAMMEPESNDDWWKLHLARFVRKGKDQKHGAWREWYPNGQLRVEGHYEYGVPKSESPWTWWYSNGQKAVEGEFADGKKAGSWYWWYQSGQRKVEGHFAENVPSGAWVWWQKDGKVAQKASYIDDAQTAESQLAEEAAEDAIPSPEAPPAAREAKPLTENPTR